MISGKRGKFGDPENQRFLKNRGLLKVKVSVKGGIFSTWRTLMGLTNSLRVGVPGTVDQFRLSELSLTNVWCEE